MIRTVVTPDKNFLSINIPDMYIGKRMEVIAFALDEPAEEVLYHKKSRKSFSAVNLSTKGFKFNRDEANKR